MLKNSHRSYGRVARALHWLGALAVIAALACIELKGFAPKGSAARDWLKLLHFQAGLFALLLALPRLFWRLVNPQPVITPPPSPGAQLLAHAAHWLLYGLMLALPLLGILLLQAAGKPLDFLGLPLPTLVPPAPSQARNWKDAHELLGNVMMGLIALHAAAAIWHHRIIKDDTLTRLTGPLR